MRTAFSRDNVIGKGNDIFRITGRILHGNIHFHAFAHALKMRYFFKQRILIPIQVANKFTDTALIVKDLLFGILFFRIFVNQYETHTRC